MRERPASLSAPDSRPDGYLVRCRSQRGLPALEGTRVSEPIELDQLPAEERERVLRDLFGETENDCE